LLDFYFILLTIVTDTKLLWFYSRNNNCSFYCIF